jgi:hypothetical protein
MRFNVTVGISLGLLVFMATQPGLSETPTVKRVPNTAHPSMAIPNLSQSLATIKKQARRSLPPAPVMVGKKCNPNYKSCENNLYKMNYCAPVYDKCMSLPASEGPIAEYDGKAASKDVLCAGLDPSACGTKLANLQEAYCQTKVPKCFEENCGSPCN